MGYPVSWLMSVLIGGATGVLGLLCVGILGNACVRWYHVSSFEGQSGYFVIGIALLGGIVGFGIGLGTALIMGASGGSGFLKALGTSSALALVLTGIAAGLCWKLADIPPTIDGQELKLEVELRLPVGEEVSPSSSGGQSYLELGSVVNHRQRNAGREELDVSHARREEGRWIVPGSVDIYTMRGRRSLGITMHGRFREGFLVPLPARPGKEFENWSDWLPRKAAEGQSWPETRISYRFRVQPVAAPPPGPTGAKTEGPKTDGEQAAFDALAPDAPIEQWLRYTRYGAPEARLQAAVARITSRTNFVAELAVLMRSEAVEVASDALRVVEHISEPPRELNVPVAEAGQSIASLMRQINAASVEQDPGFQGAADVSVRFNAWMVAVRTLREKDGGDFTPELRAILELSRVREDSQVIQQDVRRVASYYLHEWAGVEPLPTDPKPR